MLTATGLNLAGSSLLFTKGAPSVMARPALQSADAIVVKSPSRIAAVGTKDCCALGLIRVIVSWYAPKKNILFFLIGPPIVPPN